MIPLAGGGIDKFNIGPVRTSDMLYRTLSLQSYEGPGVQYEAPFA